MGLDDIIKEAQLVEDQNLMIQWSIDEMKFLAQGEGTKSAKLGSQRTLGRYPNASSSSMKSVTVPKKEGVVNTNPPMKRLSDSEFRAR